MQRAKIILMNAEGTADTAIAKELKINRLTVRLCLEKCILMGVETHKYSREKGFYNLSKLLRSKLWTILNEMEIKPHKIKYYLEKRDPEFETKMMQILMVYKEIEITNKKCAETNASPDKISISYDENPESRQLVKHSRFGSRAIFV